jgi:hypothetical protein
MPWPSTRCIEADTEPVYAGIHAEMVASEVTPLADRDKPGGGVVRWMARCYEAGLPAAAASAPPHARAPPAWAPLTAAGTAVPPHKPHIHTRGTACRGRTFWRTPTHPRDDLRVVICCCLGKQNAVRVHTVLPPTVREAHRTLHSRACRSRRSANLALRS